MAHSTASGFVQDDGANQDHYTPHQFGSVLMVALWKSFDWPENC